LLNLNPKNILLSWSLNPEIHSSEEKGTAPVKERIEAARLCAEAGYRVAFHFDPLIYSEDFSACYGALLNILTEKIPEKSVDFISLSCFRGPHALFDKMRERPQISKLLKGDFVNGIDGKFRYFKALRMEMLGFMTASFAKLWPSVLTYYCMEHASVWQSLKGFDPGEREEFERMFF
jgi:spore photoproduct lyase